ncbi:hypothetical protein HaLaN_06225, partial [Haematococcus lacustris]
VWASTCTRSRPGAAAMGCSWTRQATRRPLTSTMCPSSWEGPAPRAGASAPPS